LTVNAVVLPYLYIYILLLKKGGSREKGGGGNEIYAPCACDIYE
jgi:hypothetical protein